MAIPIPTFEYEGPAEISPTKGLVLENYDVENQCRSGPCYVELRVYEMDPKDMEALKSMKLRKRVRRRHINQKRVDDCTSDKAKRNQSG